MAVDKTQAQSRQPKQPLVNGKAKTTKTPSQARQAVKKDQKDPEEEEASKLQRPLHPGDAEDGQEANGRGPRPVPLGRTFRDALRQGDGDSAPSSPPNEKRGDPRHPFALEVTVDVMAWLLFAASFATRTANLDQPRHVVFDEMHYGKYIGQYIKRTFFFDSNPPLGKLLIAGVAYLANFDGQFAFDKIGVPYPPEVPLKSLRFLPALCGSLVTPTVYLILCQLGLSPWAGALAGCLVILDTALLAQSRFILLESMMILFSLWGLLSALKMRTHRSAPFSLGWCLWLTVTAVCMGCAFSVKYLAFYGCVLTSGVLLRDFWTRIGDKSVKTLTLVLEFFVQSAVVTILPLLIYVGLFYVHLCILTKAGVHDALMTSAFQASLEGGLSSIVAGQPLNVAHGSQITLRHTHGRTCWMHSHEQVYPVRYPDGRGSSHQQQVSCYGYKDVNNWWIVKRPERNDLAVHEPIDVIKHGDVIQLVHGMTHRALNSHDVAAPMTPHCQEVTCYIDYNISMKAENLWRVEIHNIDQKGTDIWKSIGSQVKLIHVSTGQALKFSGKVYPEWGFYQNEIVCDKNHNQLDTIWNVEEHRYTKNDEDKKSIEREIFGAELIPESPTQLSFWEKFLELQIKMLVTNQENVQNHNYASEPSEWPFLTRGIAYFIAKDSNAQVHLLGNLTIWYSGTVAVIFYAGLLVFYLLRRRRLCYDLPERLWSDFTNAGEILLGGYLCHFIPFYFYDRTLFLHHYLPAYIYKIMITAFVLVHLFSLIRLKASNSRFVSGVIFLITFLWLGAVFHTFYMLSPLAYGITPLTSDQVKELRWKDTWDLIIHKQ